MVRWIFSQLTSSVLLPAGAERTISTVMHAIRDQKWHSPSTSAVCRRHGKKRKAIGSNDALQTGGVRPADGFRPFNY